MLNRRAWLLAALAAAASRHATGAAPFSAPIVQARNMAEAHPLLASALARLYPSGAAVRLWTDAIGQPTPAATQALQLLSQAGEEGLDAADYRSGPLAAQAAVLRSAEPGPQEADAFDLALSVAVLHFLRDLNRGRVDPSAIGFRIPGRVPVPDLAGALLTALAEQQLPSLPTRLRPPLVQYDALLAELQRQRRLAKHARWSAALPPAPRPVRIGQAWPGVAALRERLIAYGDLPSSAAPDDSSIYDTALAGAVRRFQARHGIEADGVLGRGTLAALQVPPAQRARQIALALERLRWLPPLAGERLLAVNIPMFQLWASNGAAGGQAPAMRVVVGRALSTQTPPFAAEMTHLILRPYWNVPRSIVRGEIMPAIARDAEYLARQDMEIVRGPGDDAQPVPASADNLARLARGELRVRQRPGPRNALGLVKFVLPNNESIYLHGTPAQQLFGRPRRDFSHGCVRLEDPLALAAWALQDQPQWPRERILAGMNGTRPQRVDFTRPIRVLLYYVTALVLPQDGGLRFAEDIYRYDARLERALAARRLP